MSDGLRPIIAPLAQRLERVNYSDGVEGSNPSGSIMKMEITVNRSPFRSEINVYIKSRQSSTFSMAMATYYSDLSTFLGISWPMFSQGKE